MEWTVDVSLGNYTQSYQSGYAIKWIKELQGVLLVYMSDLFHIFIDNIHIFIDSIYIFIDSSLLSMLLSLINTSQQR